MMENSTIDVGIDTGKDYLDVAVQPGDEVLRVSNDAKGHRYLLAWLNGRAVGRVGIEASGGYERDVVERLRGAGLSVLVLQPSQVRSFARYKLKRAKNDRIDAKMIAGCVGGVESRQGVPDPRIAPLAEHLRLIEQLEADLVRAKTRLESYRQAWPRRVLAREIGRLERRLKAEMALLLKQLAQHEDLTRRLALIESVEGIGRRTAIALLLLMPELGSLSREEAAALAGLAPYDHDSGTHKGTRRIAGGRGRVRRALFAAALPASFRWNKALRELYSRLTSAGKPHKKALAACARKLLTFANVVLQRGSPWQPASALI